MLNLLIHLSCSNCAIFNLNQILRNMLVTSNVHIFFCLKLLLLRNSEVALQLNEMSQGVLNAGYKVEDPQIISATAIE
jgi:hypothetical protein